MTATIWSKVPKTTYPEINLDRIGLHWNVEYHTLSLPPPKRKFNEDDEMVPESAPSNSESLKKKFIEFPVTRFH